jgi:tetratricopeptide (TPR) repeat protein
VKKVAFALLLIASTALLVPTRRQMTVAFQRSAPHPEMEGYFERRLAKEGDVPDVLRELIRIRRLQGDRDGEIALRERLNAADPGDATNLEDLVDACVWTSRSERAYGYALRLLDRFPERRDLHELLLDLSGYIGRGDQQYRHARWLLEHGSRDPRMVHAAIAVRDAAMLDAVLSSPADRSEALVAIGAQKEAMEACLEQLALDPADFATMRRLALLYRWNRRPLDAAGLMEKMLWLRPDPALRNELIDLYRGVGRIDLMLPHLPEGKERADLLLALGRVEEAKALYRKLGHLDMLLSITRGSPSEDDEIALREEMPRTTSNLTRLADLYAWKKDFRRAVALYDQLDDDEAIELYLALGDFDAALRTARRLGLHRRLGDLYLWKGDVENAIKEYEIAGGVERDLVRLYILVGRKEDALRILDTLTEEDPYTLAELYLAIGRGDRALGLLSRILPQELDLRRVEMLLKGGDLKTQAQLYRLLLKRDPLNERWLAALARACEWMEDRAGMIDALRALLPLRPDDLELCAKLGLLLNDRKLLEKAAALGCKDPRVYRMLAEFARAENRRQDAIAWYRRFHSLDKGDSESHFALGELCGDAAEYDLAWRLLPPDERKIRVRILIHRKQLEAAIALLKEDQQWETLVELLFELKRFAEAATFPLTPRQAALVAYHLGRYEEAVTLLKRLDLRDPSLRVALGDSLFATGQWMEAKQYASPELERHIDLSYGPEESGGVQITDGPLDQQLAASAHYRMYLGQPTYVRLNAQVRDLKGRGEQLPQRSTVQVEDAEAWINYLAVPALRLSAAAGGWHSDVRSSAEGLAEIEFRKETWNVGVMGAFNDAWDDGLRAAALGGSRNGVQARTFVTAIPQRLQLSGGIEQWWYESHDDAGRNLDGEKLDEFRARARTELRLWTGEGSTGKYFYDLWLVQDSAVDTHLGMSLQADYSRIGGSAALLSFTQLPPSTEMVSFGPTASWADGTFGLSATAFVGFDPARNLAFGKLWGGSAGIVLIPADRWKILTSTEYTSESRTAIKGSSWSALVGLHYNF